MIPSMRGRASPLLAVLLALVVVVPVAAKEPFRPIPGHQPRFITEMDSRGPSADCLWASAQMYLDKLTAGRAVVDHERLRTLSGSRTRGATLAEVKTAMREAGLPFAFSPGGGDPLTWTTLLARLERGGGAIVEGTYHALPRRYGRWDPAFWADPASYHAVYIERYDRASDRVWLMDPLATGSWKGEWIAVRYLVRFVWHTGGGLLYAAATPAAAPLPFAGVTLEAPTASVFADRVTVAWPVESAPADWTPSGRFVPSVERLPEGIVLPPEIVTNPAPTASVAGNLLGAPASPLDPKVRRSAGAVTADIALPSEPGLYRIGGDLLESRFDDRVGVAPPRSSGSAAHGAPSGPSPRTRGRPARAVRSRSAAAC